MTDLKSKLKAAIVPGKPKESFTAFGGMYYEPDSFLAFYRELNERLDRVLADAVVVEGNVEFDHWQSQPFDRHPEAQMSGTHTALLLGIEPLNPKDERVTKGEILEFLRTGGHAWTMEREKLAHRIETHGIKGEAPKPGDE